MPESILQRPPTRTEQLKLSNLRTSIVRDASAVSLRPRSGRQAKRRLDNVLGHPPVGVQPGRNRVISDAGRRPDTTLRKGLPSLP